jgi:hypothetical protein
VAGHLVVGGIDVVEHLDFRPAPVAAEERFDDYRPSLRQLRSAFLSFAIYGLMAVRLPEAADQAIVWAILSGAVAILYLTTRDAPAD